MVLAETQIEVVVGVGVCVLLALVGAYVNVSKKLREAKVEADKVKREADAANAESKIKIDDMQRDFWVKHSDAIRAQVRGEVANEVQNLSNRINALTEAHLKCETDRIQVSADLRVALLRIAELEKRLAGAGS